MENPRPEEEKLIKDIRKIKQLKTEYLEILRIFLSMKKNEPVRASNFWSNNYIEYDSNCGRKKAISVETYLNKISQYLKDIINNLRRSNT